MKSIDKIHWIKDVILFPILVYFYLCHETNKVHASWFMHFSSAVCLACRVAFHVGSRHLRPSTRPCNSYCSASNCFFFDYLLICIVGFCVSMKKPPGPEVSCSFSKYNGAAAQDPAPIISVPTQSRASPSLNRTCSQDSTAETDTASTSFTDQPIFFRCV